MSKHIRFEVYDRYMIGTCCTYIYLLSAPITIVAPPMVRYMLS